MNGRAENTCVPCDKTFSSHTMTGTLQRKVQTQGLLLSDIINKQNQLQIDKTGKLCAVFADADSDLARRFVMKLCE